MLCFYHCRLSIFGVWTVALWLKLINQENNHQNRLDDENMCLLQLHAYIWLYCSACEHKQQTWPLIESVIFIYRHLWKAKLTDASHSILIPQWPPWIWPCLSRLECTFEWLLLRLLHLSSVKSISKNSTSLPTPYLWQHNQRGMSASTTDRTAALPLLCLIRPKTIQKGLIICLKAQMSRSCIFFISTCSLISSPTTVL